jgi:fatty acid desaturase
MERRAIRRTIKGVFYRRGGAVMVIDLKEDIKMQKLKYLMSSRKFWACVAAIATAVTAAATGETSWAVAVNLIVAALAAYTVGTGLDNGGTTK